MGVWKKINYKKDENERSVNIRVHKTMTWHEQRRILSEVALEKELTWHFEKGVTYHVLSWGDIDSLTYLRLLVKQQYIEYAMITTWAMAATDIKEIGLWLDKGYIGRLDFYVGDIFKSSYELETKMLHEICIKHKCKFAVLKNHSKMITAFGEKFDAVVESSANLNTNPRIEQAAITIDTELALFYKNIFDEFQPFNTDFEQPEKYEIKR